MYIDRRPYNSATLARAQWFYKNYVAISPVYSTSLKEDEVSTNYNNGVIC